MDVESTPSTARQGPFQHLIYHLGPPVLRSPALDQTGIEIHDPVFADARSLVNPAFRPAIPWSCRRRQYLDGEEWNPHRGPALEPFPGGASHDKQIRLHERARAEHHVRGRSEQFRVVAALQGF